VFRGWMLRNQMADLKGFQNQLQWQCTVEKLFAQAQPPEALRGKIQYLADHGALSFAGFMRDEDRAELLELGDAPVWQTAVEQLYQRSRRETTVAADSIPARFAIPPSPTAVVSYEAGSKQLRLQGPMSIPLRDDLTGTYARFPLAKPLEAPARQSFLEAI